MQKYINKGKIGALTLFLMIGGAMFTACQDDVLVGKVDKDPYEASTKSYGYLRNVQNSRTKLPVEVRETTTVSVKFGVTKVVEKDVVVTIATDESLVAAFNTANATSYPIFPSDQVTISANGSITLPKWRLESGSVDITIVPGTLAKGTYLLPVKVANVTEGLKISKDSDVLYYFVQIMGEVPSTAKPGGIKTLCYIEVNAANILNVGSYTLEDSGIPFFDMCVIFAANINFNKLTGKVELTMNPNVTHILANRDKYIKPLQDKGIKVILGLLGNHDFTGMASLSGEGLTGFVAQCKAAVEAYGLDGVDFDDEWSDYSYYGSWEPSSSKYARLIIAMREAMPDKILTYFEYGTYPEELIDGVNMSDVLDYSMYAMYGSGFATHSQIAMPKERYSPTAVWVNTMNPYGSTMRRNAQRTKDDGYGFFFAYDLREWDASGYLSNASEPMYGESVVMSGPSFPRDY